jgi:hypothetical protein
MSRRVKATKRLEAVLAKTRRVKAEAERISADPKLVAAKAREAAAKDWPKIVEEIERRAESLSGGEINCAEAVIEFCAPGLLESAFLHYVVSYRQAVKEFLPDGFEVQNNERDHWDNKFPIAFVHIRWWS